MTWAVQILFNLICESYLYHEITSMTCKLLLIIIMKDIYGCRVKLFLEIMIKAYEYFWLNDVLEIQFWFNDILFNYFWQIVVIFAI